jgi:AcrR family transcriptional regulator
MSQATPPRPAETRIYAGATLEDRRADQRRRLLNGARDTFVAKGYAASTVDDIVARAHTSRTAFYRLFSNKEDCLLELYRDATATLVINLVKAADAAASPAEQVRLGVAALVETLSADRSTARVMLIEVVGATPAVEAARIDARSRFAAIIAREIGAAPGWKARPNSERELVATATMGAVAEVMSDLATRDTLNETEVVIEHLTAYALRALTPPG